MDEPDASIKGDAAGGEPVVGCEDVVSSVSLGERTMREIIEDARSGLPSKSSVDTLRKRRLLRKQKVSAKRKRENGHDSDNTTECKEDDSVSVLSGADSGILVPVPAPNPVSAEENSSSIMAPQVRVIDGKLVVDQSSLVQDARELRGVVNPLDRPAEIHGDEANSRLTGSSFTKRPKPIKWTQAETQLFYRALQKYGSDFTVIATLFPNRTRRHIRNKYIREDKLRPRVVDAALSNRMPMDLSDFSQLQASPENLLSASPESARID